MSNELEIVREEATKISRGRRFQAEGTIKAKALVDVKSVTHYANAN